MIISFVVFLVLSGLIIAYVYRRSQAHLYQALRRYEQAERKSQELFRATLYSIGDAVITTDPDGTVRQMNRVRGKGYRLAGGGSARQTGSGSLPHRRRENPP